MNVETLDDDIVVFRDGDWCLVDPRPTIGDSWRVFDGWWKPADGSVHDTRAADQYLR